MKFISYNNNQTFLPVIGLILLVLSNATFSQEQKPREKYLLGPEQQLQIVVHIWGEVNKPGDYLVPDGTNVLELISKAGGPTNYANLSHIVLTSEAKSYFVSERTLLDIIDEVEQSKVTKESLEKSLKDRFSHRIVHVNVKQYLEDPDTIAPIPTLKPGDVVRVKQNFWHKWRTAVRLASEVAVIASVYVWYLRAEKWN